jgi:HPr kinase/phosphorylase
MGRFEHSDRTRVGRRAFRPRKGRVTPELPNSARTTLHASAVAFASPAGPTGVLVLGASGSGKSGLVLRLMVMGATLVSDDRVTLRLDEAGALIAEAPTQIAGLIEARGVGVLRVEPGGPAPVGLAVDLDHEPERLPLQRKITLLGRDVALISGRGVPNLDAIITLLAQSRAVVTEHLA